MPGRPLSLQLLALSCLSLGPESVLADSFRCNRSIVREGMSVDEIREKCGAPDLVRTRKEPVMSRLVNGRMVRVGVSATHFWFYDRGPNEFVVQIAVRESVAQEITLLSIRNIDALPDE